MNFKEFYLQEMPHGVDGDVPVDFQLEKSNWNEIMIDLIKNSDDIEELLKPFYSFMYGKLLKKRFNLLSDEQKKELLDILPDEFIMDMHL